MPCHRVGDGVGRSTLRTDAAADNKQIATIGQDPWGLKDRAIRGPRISGLACLSSFGYRRVPRIQVPEILVVRITVDFGERCISLYADSGERTKENSFGATGGGDRLRITPGSVTSTLAPG
jgi:hypothetical protein